MPSRRVVVCSFASLAGVALAGCSAIEDSDDTGETGTLPDSNGENPTDSGGNTPPDSGTESEPEPEPSPTPDPEPAEVLVDERIDVPRPGHYVNGFELFAPHEIHWEIFVRSGEPVNVYFTDRSEFDEYDAGNRFRYYSELSRQEVVSASATGVLRSGNYSFILDTRRGDLADILEDEVAVDVRLELTPE